jgi:hypothetical protein
MQVTVLLETEEQVCNKWLMQGHRSSGRSGIRHLYQEVLEVTHDVLLTSFQFTLPRDAPETFATPIVSLRWQLRFEFVLQGAHGGRWAKPDELVWLLPLAVAAA